jgi:two-component system, LytTR family, response regulator
MIRALIVDDVDLAREAIRIRLRDEPAIEVVGEASSGPEAVSAVRALAPDLLFLDIQMPGMDAFQVLESLQPGSVPSIIFVTAHDKYAIKAFEAHALHFLLKPIDDDQFKEALRRARRELADDEARDHAGRNLAHLLESRAAELLHTLVKQAKPNHLTRLAAKDHGDFMLINVEDIDWIESSGNYAELHAGGRTFLLRMIFSDLEEKLDPASFARISRSAIVNISRIQRIKSLWHGDFQAVLKDGSVLRMSRRYRKRLLP